MSFNRCFQIGDRVRVNFWVDRRESGWRSGTVAGRCVNCYGANAQSVRWDAGYETLMAVDLLEPEVATVGVPGAERD